MEKKITDEKVGSPASPKSGKLHQRKTQPTLRFALLDAQGTSDPSSTVNADFCR